MPKPHRFHKGQGTRVTSQQVNLTRESFKKVDDRRFCAVCNSVLAASRDDSLCGHCRRIAGQEAPEHGTYQRYRNGCNCKKCRAANNAWGLKYKKEAS